jgi:hypothetical protein
MWRTIQAGEPCVAYVRNKTEDGRGYWVIATILPLEDGYLSVRIKPTSPLFATIRGLYAQLLLAERNEGLSIEASEARLLAELAKLGFADYTSFMHHALFTEFRARELTKNHLMVPYFNENDKIRASLDSTAKHQEELIRNFDRLRDLPTNMRIIASRLEPSGGPISAISDIYNATSNELFQEISDFAEGKKSLCRRMQTSFEISTFTKLCSLLMAEVIDRTRTEDLSGSGIDHAAEATILGNLGASYGAQERATLIEAEQMANAMNRASSDLRRSMLGLDTIRVMGRVESGRLGAEGNRIGATIDQIDTCHSGIIGLLQKIMDNARIINAGVSSLRRHVADRPALAAR